jgi:hypothetical protein
LDQNKPKLESVVAALIHSTKRKEDWLLEPWNEENTKPEKLEEVTLNDPSKIATQNGT